MESFFDSLMIQEEKILDSLGFSVQKAWNGNYCLIRNADNKVLHYSLRKYEVCMVAEILRGVFDA